MRLRLVLAASVLPVTLVEAKASLRVDVATDDTLITSHITTATAQLDGRDGILGRAIVTQTWELVLAAFPAHEITIPLPPLQSITSIKYQDSANVETTLASTSYVIDKTSEPALIYPVTTWPSTYSTPNAVVIQFIAGYGAAGAVPEPIKSAIKLRVQSLYDNLKPEDYAGVDRAHSALIFPYRLVLA